MCCTLWDGNPCISGLGRVESRRSPGGGKNSGQRFKDQKWRWVGVGVGVRVIVKMSKLREECRELDQVVDSIFELKIIHAREVAYMRSRAIGG
jgi:hypothetical protein